jgi:hypothetical protein
LTGKEQCPVDISLIPAEVKSLITVIKGQVFLLGKDWDNLLEPEKKELALSAVKSVSELNDLVRGEPEAPDLRVIG